MRVFVVGAGVSKMVGYPLGAELFRELDAFVMSSGKCIDRFRYDTDWPELIKWLAKNPELLIADAYRSGYLEYVFTSLDLACMWGPVPGVVEK
jgi:hypothetical protein